MIQEDKFTDIKYMWVLGPREPRSRGLLYESAVLWRSIYTVYVQDTVLEIIVLSPTTVGAAIL